MFNHQRVRSKLEKVLDSEGIRVRYKDSSKFMWLLGKILFFNPKFMTDYITTIHRTVYFPTKDFTKDDYRVWSIMAHEAVHAADSKKWTFPLFASVYLFPQVLSLLALGAIGAFWDLSYLWFLVSLVLLAPLPAYGRMKFEMRGYAVSMAAYNWTAQIQNTLSGSDRITPLQESPDWAVDQFVGSSYYWMWPFKGDVEARLDGWLARISYEQIEKDIPIAGVVKAIVFEELRENG